MRRTDCQLAPGVGPECSLAAVVLNWNGWRYTLNCLETLLRSDYAELRIVVCDNGSTDDSWHVFQLWAQGKVSAPPPSHPRLASLLTTPRRRKAKCVFLEDHCVGSESLCSSNVIFVRRNQNQGYGAGNNAGIRYALRVGADYVWILNNDTLVEPSAPRLLVEYIRSRSKVGMCGTVVMNYDDPATIQVLGGWHWNKWIAKPTPLLSPDRVLADLSYIQGASLCVSRNFLDEVGFLAEEYFLFCEEMDWVLRAAKRFQLDYCPDAVVFHKSGASFGKHDSNLKIRSAEFYSMRARLMLTRKFWPRIFPIVWISMLGRVLHWLAKGRIHEAGMIVHAMAQEHRRGLSPTGDPGMLFR